MTRSTRAKMWYGNGGLLEPSTRHQCRPQEQIEQQLLAYCKLDTYAMYACAGVFWPN